MAKRKQVVNQNERTKYCGAIPMKIVKDMTPELKIQYFFWDEMLKRQIQLHPGMLLPLIREIFGKEYPVGTSIKMLSTEYVTDRPYKHGEKRIESIFSDLLVQVGRKDIYHLECQMKQGGDIAVRMLEYDMNGALIHGKEWVKNTQKNQSKNTHPYKHRLNFPKSVILYLDTTEQTVSEESCTAVFPDGTEYEYCIPVLKVQDYTPEMMAEKNLNILIPFSVIRFRRRFNAIIKDKKNPEKYSEACEKMEILKKDLTNFVTDCIMIINREEENETLEYRIGAEIVELLGRACDHLYDKEPELLREVRKVMEPVIKLARDEIEEQKEAEIKEIEKKKEAEIKKKEAEIKKKDVEIKKKDTEIKEIERKKEAEIKYIREENAKQLDRFIENCIHQCKLAGNGKHETLQILQKLLLDEAAAREKMEKYW